MRADRIRRAENERLVEDLQDKLEEARAEISQRRKDEKDMKGKERALLIQISGVSTCAAFTASSLADLGSSRQTLPDSPKAWKRPRRITPTCRRCIPLKSVSKPSRGLLSMLTRPDEAQRLRGILRDRDTEIQGLEENAQGHAADEAKVCDGRPAVYDAV